MYYVFQIDRRKIFRTPRGQGAHVLGAITYADSDGAAVNNNASTASEAEKPAQSAPKQKAEKGAPLPLFTIDGVGGVVLTPIAYLVNAGAEGTEIGLPSFGATYVNARQKNVESFAVSETLFRTVEVGYNASRFGTGSLQSDVLQYAGANIDRNDVWLHTFNIRANVISENDFG